jgi:hypothetical protein
MDPKHYLFVDERLLGRCVYCGSVPDTRDHVPSKILLDDPLPANLAVVEACVECNRGVSLDEEYLACFLECALVGSSEVERVRRTKVKRALLHNPRLAKRIKSSSHVDEEGRLVWTPEGRVTNVLVKLARGHAAYELSLICIDAPREVVFRPLSAMSASERESFEGLGTGEIRGWPEVGSRAFLRACGAEPYSDHQGPWVVVQPGQYRYAVDQHGGVRVQIVLAEYVAGIVDWE